MSRNNTTARTSQRSKGLNIDSKESGEKRGDDGRSKGSYMMLIQQVVGKDRE